MRTAKNPTPVARIILVFCWTSAALSGCVGNPTYDPLAQPVVQERSSTTAILESLTPVSLGSDFTQVAEGTADTCGSAGSEGAGFNQHQIGFRCQMGWMGVFAYTGTGDRAQIAAGVDSAICASGMPYMASMAADYGRRLYETQLDLPMTSGAASDSVRFFLESRVFRPDTFRAPRIGGATGEVSSSGNLDNLTATDLKDLGAVEFVAVSVLIEYWNTLKAPDVPALPDDRTACDSGAS